MANMFCPIHLTAELDKTHQTIRVIQLAVTGEQPYPQPVPCLQSLQRYARELQERLSLTFPVSHQLGN